jgi:HEPN domain-containing protein
MKPLTREWIDKAEGDHQAALTLQAATTPLFDAMCFHCQQTTEKYFKAWLVEQGLTFPHTHDLEVLARLSLPTLPEVTGLLHDLRFVTSFAVEIRYPGTTALVADASRCLVVAGDVRSLVRSKLGL